MYDQVVTRARMRLQDHGSHGASLRKPAVRLEIHFWSIPLLTAIVAFAAGWLVASYF